MDETGDIAPLQILPGDGEATYHRAFISRAEAELLQERLLREIPWRHDEVVVFGRTRVTARKVSWHGDEGCHYAYAGKLKHALPWTECLRDIKLRVEERVGLSFNSCLLNLYHSGAEGMGWHRDNEPELGPRPVIASVSLGATRRFLFRHRVDCRKVEVALGSGSLLVMAGECQQFWLHSLPKALRVRENRVNLTFRRIQ